MENIIVKNDNVLGFTKEIKLYFENEVEKCDKRIKDLQSEELYVAKVCGSVDSIHYNNLVEDIANIREKIKDLLEDLKNVDDDELICVQENCMEEFYFEKVALYTTDKLDKKLIIF